MWTLEWQRAHGSPDAGCATVEKLASKSPKDLLPMLDRSMSGMSAMLSVSIDSVYLKISFVMRSGAGSPAVEFILMPQSSSGPPAMRKRL